MKDGRFTVWPAIDLVNGECVRLVRGEFKRPTVYSPDPVSVAMDWVGRGARGLHIVDLDGARAGAPVHLELAARVAAQAGVPVQFGGGLRRLGDVVRAAQAGLRPIVGTRAIMDPVFLGHALSLADDLVLAVDVRDGQVATHGWTEMATESIGGCLGIARDIGVRTVLVTDVSKDGTLTGPNLELAATVAAGGIEVIAAGGIRSLADVGALAEIEGVGGCVIGKALYEGEIDPGAAFAVGKTVVTGPKTEGLVDRLRFGPDGLIPVIVQDSVSGTVLMVAYADRAAIQMTLSTGDAHFFSRSRGRLWRKGETSGNTMQVVDLRPDCDGDALLMTVAAAGPACHTGKRSCFDRPGEVVSSRGSGILDEVWAVLSDRKRRPQSGSYSSGLLAGGVPSVARKLGEEAIEAILALSNEPDDRLISEIADLWFFSLAALCLRGVAPAAVYQELAARRQPVKEGNSDHNSN